MSINERLAELDRLTIKIRRIGERGVNIPTGEQPIYRQNSISEYSKLRTLFRIRRTELVRLLRGGTALHDSTCIQHHHTTSSCSSSTSSSSVITDNPTSHHSHEETSTSCSSSSSCDKPHPCPPHRARSPSYSSSSSDSEKEDTDKDRRGSCKLPPKHGGCAIYSPCDDDPLSDDNIDLSGMMKEAIEKIFPLERDKKNENGKRKIIEESTSDVADRSVFTIDSEDSDHHEQGEKRREMEDISFIHRLELIKTRVEQLASDGKLGETFTKIQAMRRSVGKMLEEGASESQLDKHICHIVDELNKIEAASRL